MNKFQKRILPNKPVWASFILSAFVLNSGCSLKHIPKKSVNEKNHGIIAEKSSTVRNLPKWTVEFSEDFSDMEIGTEPENLFILDGAYAVQDEGRNNKTLALPGSPMGDFGLLFGPRIREKGLELRFSFFSTRKGRRMPSVAAGIGGVRGIRLRLNPAARNLVLSLDENKLQEMPFAWTGDQWWSVRFQTIPEDSNQSTFVQCKLWPKEENEPEAWLFSEKFSITYKGGKCALWGYPYASTPILFDNLSILSK